MSRVGAFLAVLLVLASPSQAAPPRAESKRINLDVVRADLHDVLRILADVGRLNLVVSEQVRGKVTLKLKNVPWREALDTVLASHALGQEIQGNVLRVAPLKELAAEAADRVKLKQAREEAAPLRTFFIPVSHARAAELLPHVQAQLSPRGKVSVDERTNTLIVTDVEPVALP
ncbi:secretin and TonB N-terminal domain-containing protein [Stigmatella sp. ncwal1]|uniref:Secretin and TonB N-terminal domain-containing protein n=1 Tax=Stigmatella ashevillensis TaxID=2995309 RepID=A0ABT5DDY6_9BACT|nr:secretin and TonB N-terminal domain-containing protein [Stigmatella ashevillena]MDC0711833.1 secretin and TonB N-terminal domain-containing protein [Stigmatella ashevillena]